MQVGVANDWGGDEIDLAWKKIFKQQIVIKKNWSEGKYVMGWR